VVRGSADRKGSIAGIEVTEAVMKAAVTVGALGLAVLSAACGGSTSSDAAEAQKDETSAHSDVPESTEEEPDEGEPAESADPSNSPAPSETSEASDSPSATTEPDVDSPGDPSAESRSEPDSAEAQQSSPAGDETTDDDGETSSSPASTESPDLGEAQPADPKPEDPATADPATVSTTTPAPNDDDPDEAEPVPPEPIERPELVTSGEGAYWEVGQLSVGSAEQPEVVVDTEQSFQTWQGFGGTFHEQGWYALSQLPEAERERALRLLFDAREGTHFVWGRLPIGASEYALDRYSLDDTENDFAMEDFSIDRDRMSLIPYLEAALAINPDLRLWAIPWSPPAWMKQNASMDRGSIKDDSLTLDAYALYLARYVEEYAAAGFSIEAVAIQNEPSVEMAHPSCVWQAETYRRFVADYLGPRFLERDVPADIWLGVLADPADSDLITAFMGDTALDYVGGIGAQWGASEFLPELRSQLDLPFIQTQHQPDNLPWLVDFVADRAPNDHETALLSWELLREWIEAGVSVYHAWHMVLDPVGEGINEETPWPKSALLVADADTGSLRVTPKYYVFRHLAGFVEPGAVRVEARGELEALAFRNPDGAVITVLHNPDAAERDITLGIDEARLALTVPARGWATVNWQ
jgi:glucosylceramidase